MRVECYSLLRSFIGVMVMPTRLSACLHSLHTRRATSGDKP